MVLTTGAGDDVIVVTSIGFCCARKEVVECVLADFATLCTGCVEKMEGLRE